MNLLLILLIVLIIIIIIYIIFIAYFSLVLPSYCLPHEVIWQSEPGMYNPSISGNAIAIRESQWNKHTWSSLIWSLNNKDTYSDICIRINGENKKLNLNYEDPRIFYHSNKYYIIATQVDKPKNRELKDIIYPVLIKLNSKLDVISIKKFNTEPFPKPTSQKNWNLFYDLNGKVRMLTHVYPELQIWNVDLDEARIFHCRKIDTVKFFPDNLAGIRCGTNLVKWDKNHLIAALHIKHYLKFRTVFILIDDKYQPVNYSETYHFFDKYIEFASGLAWSGNKLQLSLGVDDNWGFIINFDPKNIKWKL